MFSAKHEPNDMIFEAYVMGCCDFAMGILVVKFIGYFLWV
jgi:hypothetical protein